jgi:hypothetical protein
VPALILRFLRPRQGWNWLWAAGLGFPLVLGVVMVIGILVSLSRSQYEPPKLFSVGQTLHYKADSPVYFETERFWLVQRTNGDSTEFIALSDVDPTSGCTVPWTPGYEFMGKKGWFRDACRGSTYDLEGRCFAGPCTRDLDRFGVFLQLTEVIVNFTDVTPGQPVDFSLQPANPSPGATP